MLAILLNIIYAALVLAAAPLLLWRAWRQGKYRQGWRAKLRGNVPVRSGDEFCVWWHAVSVGEVNVLAPLVAELRRRHPEWRQVISTTTATGYELAAKKYADLTVFYCPLDFSWAVRRAIRRIRPGMLVLAELELWPNLIMTARAYGARVAIVNGRLSDKSFRGYHRLRRLVAGLLRQVDLIAAQNQECAERFLALGAEPTRVVCTGSVKFDGVRTDRDNPATRRLAALAGLQAGDVVFLAGSTQAGEEAAALAAYEAASADERALRLILVPRHPERFDEVAWLLSANGHRWQRRSRLEIDGADPAARILLVDTVGELGAWWGTATMAFVGGSLGSRGGQNMIEPAAYGAAISFGPNTRNFRDIVAQLLAADGAVVVADTAELAAFVRRALADPAWATALGTRAQRLVVSQAGATAKTVDRLVMLAGQEPAAPLARAA